MKRTVIMTALALAASTTFAQTATVGQSSMTDSAATAGATAIGGGAGTGTATLNNTIGGTSIGGTRSSNRNTVSGGAGGTANNALSVSVYSADPSSGIGATAKDASGTTDPTTTRQDIHQSVQTVGNPGAMSYGVSFSQYNCASTAGVGAGFMGGAFQFGVGKESDPCNARANASALFSIAQALASSNTALSAQLYHAAILLIGNSTSATQEALKSAGVSDWAPAAAATPIIPPSAPTPEPAPEGKITPQPEVSSVPLPTIETQSLDSNENVVKASMFAGAQSIK